MRLHGLRLAKVGTVGEIFFQDFLFYILFLLLFSSFDTTSDPIHVCRGPLQFRGRSLPEAQLVWLAEETPCSAAVVVGVFESGWEEQVPRRRAWVNEKTNFAGRPPLLTRPAKVFQP